MQGNDTFDDVAIVLGNTFRTQQTVDSMRLRCDTAVQLWRSGACKKILFSGGYATNKDISEAQYMADMAVAKGLPVSAILLEENSKTTIENALYTKDIIESHGFQSAIIVTSFYHSFRTRYIFSRIFSIENLAFRTCGADVSPYQIIRLYLREAIGLFVTIYRDRVNTINNVV